MTRDPWNVIEEMMLTKPFTSLKVHGGFIP